MKTVLKVFVLLAVVLVMGCKPTTDGGGSETPAPLMYTVTFDSMGGSAVDSVKVENGSYISSFPYPKNTSGDSISDDLVFAGWYTVQDGNGAENRFEQSMAVTSHLTVYASWKAPTQGIVYVNNGDGTVSVGNNQNSKESEVVIARYVTVDGLSLPVTAIETSAFMDNRFLRSIIIPDSVIIIGWSAFYNSNLTSVTIPNSVTTIEDWVFSGCKSLGRVTIGNSVETIGKAAFHNSNLTSVVIPNSVKTIGEMAFALCSRLKSVAIGDSVETIGMSAFSSCYALEGKIIIPDSVTTIGLGAFWSCRALESIQCSEKNLQYSSQDGVLYTKGKRVLISYPAGKKNNSFFIPKGVETISSGAFSSSSFLTNIIIPKSVISIKEKSFDYFYYLTIYVEKDTTAGSFDVEWNFGRSPVVWGCVLSDGMEEYPYVMSVTKTENTIENADKTLNAPYREGYTFEGWSSTGGGPVLEGGADALRIAANGTLYAVWTEN